MLLLDEGGSKTILGSLNFKVRFLSLPKQLINAVETKADNVILLWKVP